MSKRVKLLRSVLSFNMDKLKSIQPYHKNFKPIAKIVTDLTNRIKKAGRRKIEVSQLEFIQTYEASFKKHLRKKINVESIDASNPRNARKLLKDKHGKKIKIITVKQIK